MKNCVLYMRMSTDKQDNSIPAQRGVLTEYAKRNKLKIIREYADEGISGRKALKRPAFMQMIDDSANGEFDIVLVYDTSRFARNLEESIVYKSTLKRNGVDLVSITEPTVDDDNAILTDAMMGALNEMYSRKLSKSVRRGMEFTASKGNYPVPPPYGYTKKNNIMTILPEEAHVVEMIFDMFIALPSWHSVAVKLNNMGMTKRKAYGWYNRDIKRMLTNPAYIGLIPYNGEIYQGKHEPIINKEKWDTVQKIISEKPVHEGRASLTYKHWLSGLVKCAHCGGPMNHVTDNKGNTSYRCSRHANGACAYSNFISVRILETLVLEALNEMLVANLLGYEFFISRPRDASEIQLLETNLSKIEKKLERHKLAYSEGIDTIEEYKANKAFCAKEKAAIQKRIAALSNTDVTPEKIDHLKKEAEELISFLKTPEVSIEQKSIAIK
ncbi:recombinase family protein, partial [Tyzzerella sp. OttesenSCG-928-J15]|nr:recombinase family protein [Tyzzerella sp. OttesenSCG-928-J15]